MGHLLISEIDSLVIIDSVGSKEMKRERIKEEEKERHRESPDRGLGTA